MPCRNAARFIERALESVYAQTLGDYELLVVDNGSTDETVRIVERMQTARTRLLHQPVPGVSHARNKGLEASRGRHIAFLDADDTLEPICLEQLVGALEAHPDAVLAYCGWQNIGLPEAQSKPFVPPDYECDDKLFLLLQSCRWPIHAALTRREAIEGAGGFDTRLSHAEDFLLWLTLAHDKPIVRVSQVLAYYHHHGAAQASAQAARSAMQHHRAQTLFLDNHPEAAQRLGRRKAAEATYGELLRRGYIAYWKRDLAAARAIFRQVMKGLYGKPKDWKYMAPALLPARWHQTLLRLGDR
jgi:glycosyltransferase involved in cell wall biosynthesis